MGGRHTTPERMQPWPACECGGQWVLLFYGLQWHLWHTTPDFEYRLDSAAVPQPDPVSWASELASRVGCPDAE